MTLTKIDLGLSNIADEGVQCLAQALKINRVTNETSSPIL